MMNKVVHKRRVYRVNQSAMDARARHKTDVHQRSVYAKASSCLGSGVGSESSAVMTVIRGGVCGGRYVRGMGGAP